MRVSVRTVLVIAGLVAAAPAGAQTLPVDDAVLHRIWQLGMVEGRSFDLAQTLMDSIGPRLTGSPGQKAAHDWAVRTYTSWGISAKNEPYGTWSGWQRGATHIDLIAPRMRTLDGTMLAWSGPTKGPVEGDVLVIPASTNAAAFEAWLPAVRGHFVAIDFAQPTCRPDRQYDEFGRSGALDRLNEQRQAAQGEFTRTRIQSTGMSVNDIQLRLQSAGALGVLRSRWGGDFGIQGIYSTNTREIPTLDLSCEDYGLVSRLAERHQGARLRVDAQAGFTADATTYNTIAQIAGSMPGEYIMLSAHFDSWDGASGATDNGTGTIVMMEAMRILKQVYPNPKRTIIAGHWSGEEQGLNGSHAWAADHPEVVRGLHALFNQDNGTGRVVNISMQGLTGAAAYFGRWMAHLPAEITQDIRLNIPGTPSGGGTDNASFICAGAPAFGLSSISWGYNPYTHHTNVDTFDKIVPDELANNATLTAMLVYLADQESTRIPRERRILPAGRGGQMMTWPECHDGARKAPGG
jgi:carboxypeptidase Q